MVPNSEKDSPDHCERMSIFSKWESAQKSLRLRRRTSSTSEGREVADSEVDESGTRALRER